MLGDYPRFENAGLDIIERQNGHPGVDSQYRATRYKVDGSKDCGLKIGTEVGKVLCVGEGSDLYK